jgi:hypothetical protein
MHKGAHIKNTRTAVTGLILGRQKIDEKKYCHHGYTHYCVHIIITTERERERERARGGERELILEAYNFGLS